MAQNSGTDVSICFNKTGGKLATAEGRKLKKPSLYASIDPYQYRHWYQYSVTYQSTSLQFWRTANPFWNRALRSVVRLRNA